MIINKHRGEVAAKFDGKDHRLCLTLGALAELEAKFDAQDVVALTERFSTGRMSSTDMLKIIAAGLRGAGHDVDDAEVANMQIDGGATGYARTVADLLTATFGDPQG
ncbi:MAG: gene transfer agent family protein [Pseudomonadota bacterium]